MKITDHAQQRGKERLKLNPASLERTARRALNDGLGRPQTHGALRTYLDGKRAMHPDGEVFLYGEFLFVFAGNVLLTCFRVPGDLHELALKQWAKWRGVVRAKRSSEQPDDDGEQENAQRSTPNAQRPTGGFHDDGR